MQRSEERRRTRQVALGLCYTRLEREGIHVVRCNIANLIKLFRSASGKRIDARYRKARAG